MSCSFDYKAFLPTVPERPGSYRMYGDEETVIYVGKAKNLRRRLSQYFTREVGAKTAALVSHIHHIEFTVTFSESEALILENNLIKQYQPRYNILLRDDKSYPFLLLTSSDKHPGLFYHRGPKRKKGEYFGPFPDATAVRASLKLLQTLFPVRQCADTVYAHRSRPCLMYQLGRCLAPCVPQDEEGERRYQEQVRLLKLFLKGRSQEVLHDLTATMEAQSQALQFEQAAKTRDQLLALRRVQEGNSVSGEVSADLDIVACVLSEGTACVHVLFIRNSHVLGTRSYFPGNVEGNDEGAVLEAFLSQFYLADDRGALLPQEIILDRELPGESVKTLSEALAAQVGHEIRIGGEVRGERGRYLKLACENARSALSSRLSSQATALQRVTALEEILGLEHIERIECFDISHTMGELTVASCVCFNRDGPLSSRYRRYNIEGITPGDDFAAMHQVLQRRYRDPEDGENPDLILIDGGKGQLHQAEEVLSELFKDRAELMPLMVGVAKGEGRKEGLETLIRGFTHETYNLTLASPALQLVLHVRDEAHRFAITGHRARRAKARTTSTLENIPGVGDKRRHALLTHLGGMREVMRAGVDELSKVPGISPELAQQIYDSLHDL